MVAMPSLSYAQWAIRFLPEKLALLHSPPLKLYKPSQPLSMTRGRFTVKVADSHRELSELFRLRYDIFHRECIGKRMPLGLDIDEFDEHYDHITIRDNENGKIIATYRVMCSQSASTFYSEKEFKLHQFLSLPDRKVELGRACIHKDYRFGLTLSLLWRGIVDYCKQRDARFLFGCASVPLVNPTEIAAMHQSLMAKGHIISDFGIRPTVNFLVPGIKPLLATPQPQSTAKLPPLLTTYLAAGAKIHGEPAYDHAFKCIDYMTILDLNQIEARFHKRFLCA